MVSNAPTEKITSPAPQPIPQRLEALLAQWGGNWVVCEKLGEGAYGKVYKIRREVLGTTYFAALKWISLPAKQDEANQLAYSGMTIEQIQDYYKVMAQDMQREINLLREMRVSNVVSYEDHTIIIKENEIGWDILIRMELLNDLSRYIQQENNGIITLRMAAELGINIGSALMACHRKKIIHRDVKPANILVAYVGDGKVIYKLGDFGIARQMEMNKANMTRRGTFEFMAPEIYMEKEYDRSIDIYSLGIVMYQMLNDNRPPFFPACPKPITPNDRDFALSERMKGKEFPRPAHLKNDMMWEVLKKACSSNPENRYDSLTGELIRDLQKVLDSGKYLDDPIIPPPQSASTPDIGQRNTEKMQLEQELREKLEPVIRAEVSQELETQIRAKLEPQMSLELEAKQKKEIQKYKKRSLILLTAGFVLIAGILATVAILEPLRATSPKNLRLVEAGSTYMQVEWSGGKAPFDIRYNPSGNDDESLITSTQDSAIRLEPLIPSTEYRLSLRGMEGTATQGVFSTGAAQTWTDKTKPYADYNMLMMDVEGVCVYNRVVQTGKSLAQIVEAGGMVQSGYSISLEPEDALSQPNRFTRVINFIWDATDYDKSFEIKNVIRCSDGRVFIDSLNYTCPGNVMFYTAVFDMTGILQTLYESYNAWPEGKISIETYIDDYLYSDYDYTITLTDGR